MTEEEKIKRKLEYLDYVENAINPSMNAKLTKFKDWVADTIGNLNIFHKGLHRKVKSLQNILKEEPNGA